MHLSKLMPNQWRSIAPIIGRTAGQCLERYEKLLEQFQESEVSWGDAKRLRPGEIDPAPETKPARPDPIDMDEDEKEMLAEARARLANTLGKKAKRKARERKLEDSRRLSSLQKRRELKAAGIESKIGTSKKRKYIDYSREIPFQKSVPAGFYNVDEENQQSKLYTLDKEARVRELAAMEGRHAKEEEEREQEKDKRRLKALFKTNAPDLIRRIAEQSDPIGLRRRLPLSLPVPQVSDAELEDVIKISRNLSMPPPDTLPRARAATQMLLGDYGANRTPLPTPLRTPQSENILSQEIHNLRILRDMAPLTGATLPELMEGTGFEGVNPRAARIATPNTLVPNTPKRTDSVNTPASSVRMIGYTGKTGIHGSTVLTGVATNNSTPYLRDEFGLNRGDDWADTQSVSDVSSVWSRTHRTRDEETRLELLQQLKKLPEPEYEYEVNIPHVEEENERLPATGWLEVEDKADVEARARAQRAQEEAAAEARKSSVLWRGLPRPLPPVTDIPSEVDAAAAIYHEMCALLLHDARRYPSTETISALQHPLGDEVSLVEIDDARLAVAKDMLRAACEEEPRVTSAEFAVVWEEVHGAVMYLPAQERLGVPSNKSEVCLFLYVLLLF